MRQTVLYLSILIVAVAFSSQGFAQSLIGDQIDVTLTGAIEIEDLGVLVTNGVEFQGGDPSTNFGAFLFPTESIDVGADSVEFAFDLPLGEMGLLTFSDLDFGAGIDSAELSGFILDPIAGVNVDVSDGISITNDENSFTLDASEWFEFGTIAEFTVQLTPTTIPEPSSFVLLSAALVGSLARRRRAV